MITIRPGAGEAEKNRCTGNCWFIACLLAALTFNPQPRAEVPGIELVFVAGAPLESGAGSDLSLGSFRAVQLSPAGHVVAVVWLTGEGVTSENREALIYCGPGSTPELALRAGAPLPDINGQPVTIDRFLQAWVDRDGGIVAEALLKPSGTHGVFAGPASRMELIAHDGMDVDGVALAHVSAPVLTPLGRLLYHGWSSDFALDALWSDRAGSDSKVITVGQSYPGLPEGTHFTRLSDNFAHLDTAPILFRARLGSKQVDGLWQYADGTMTPVWSAADPAPDFPALSSMFEGGPWLADDGSWAFRAWLSGPGIDSSNASVLYAGLGNAVRLAARSGDAIPDASGSVFGAGWTVHGLSRASRLLFGNYLRRADGDAANSLWLWQDGVLRKVAEEGQPVSGTTEPLILGFSGAGISPAGRIAFSTTLGGSPRQDAVWISDAGGDPRRVLGTGDSMPAPTGDVGEILTLSLAETQAGQRFDDRGRFLAWLYSWTSGTTLAWVDPDEILPPAAGMISGTVFEDTDDSGGFSPGDQPLAGARVDLHYDDGTGNPAGEPLHSQRTGGDGSYAFTGNLPAAYVVVEHNPPGYLSVRDSQGGNDDRIPLVLSADQSSFGNDFLDRPTPLPRNVKITLHRVEPDAVTNLETGKTAIDQPLLPVTDPARLNRLPEVSQGLVADGVTPLVLRVAFRPEEIPAGRSLDFRVARVEGGQVQGGLASHWRWLQQDWAGSPAGQVVDAARPEAFAMLTAIPMQDLGEADQAAGIGVTVEVEDLPTGAILSTHLFHIRRPPVALVHGYNTDGDWGEDFREVLGDSRPWDEADASDNFVRTVRYGQFKPWTPDTETVWALDWLTDDRLDLAGNVLNHENTLRRLDELVPKLHIAIEGQMAPLRDHWAFTRHDVVAHSQGGLLVRMLASRQGSTGSHPAFRSLENFYRGRFHRVITIGSPHNGSRFLGYLLRLAKAPDDSWSGSLPRRVARMAVTSGKAQAKFDPFGEQIRALNDPAPDSPWAPDSAASFHLVRTTIAGGRTPDESDTTWIAWVFNLNGPAGALVHPRGSDGIVDFDSMVAGSAGGPAPFNSFTLSPALPIAHSGPSGLFSEEAGLPTVGQTASPDVALHARDTLDGPLTPAFDAFPVPPLLDSVAEQQIQTAVGAGVVADNEGALAHPVIDSIQHQAVALMGSAARVRAGEAATVYRYRLEAPERTPESEVLWFAEVFGPDGVSPEAVEVRSIPGTPPSVEVTVPDSVLGDVVLYSRCTLNDGRLVWTRPETIATRLPEGATPEQIAVVSPRGEYPTGENLVPSILVRYSDGTVLLRHVTAEALTAVSSAPNVVDVSDPLRWTTGEAGRATVTVSFLGLTATSELTVWPEDRAVQGLQITSWSRGDGSFQVTVPVWDDAALRLWSSPDLGNWTEVAATTRTDPTPERATLTDPYADADGRFYRVTAHWP